MSLSNNSTTGTKSGSCNKKLQSSSEIKTKISKVFNEEYEESFNQILLLNEEQFFSNLQKRVNLCLSDSFSDLQVAESARVHSILSDLENEKKIEYRKEFNFLDKQLKLFFKEKFSKNLETNDSSNPEKSKLIKNSLPSYAIKKEKEILLNQVSSNDLFEFIAKNDDKRNFYFRKHCIFNKNHPLHACFEEQLAKLNDIKTNSNSAIVKDLNLEETNFFLTLNESSYKDSLMMNSLCETKGFHSSRNSTSLKTSYSNFLNNVRKSYAVIHGNKYQDLKKSFSNEKEISNDYKSTKNKIKFLICLFCKKVYKSKSVLMHCDFCSLPFYTCLQENKEESIYPATWEKYHCGAIVNDQMRCLKCKAYLNLNTRSNKLICSNCNLALEPSKVKWNCLVCDEEFKSNAKIYNPLEFKLIKLAIKDAILNKIPILPEEIDCCMVIREKIIKSGFNSFGDKDKEKFFLRHNKECHGLLYEGSLYNRKIVVCSECKTFVNYDKFIWFCPFCNKRYRKKNSTLNPIEADKNKEKDNTSSTKNSERYLEIKKKINLHGESTETNIKDSNEKNKFLEDLCNITETEHQKSNITIEKENLNLPYRSSNISKVINVNRKNNDAASLSRLKSKFTNSNFSSNFDSYISKAVNTKRSPLLKEALNRSINLNFSVNDIKDLKNKKNPLNFSMVNIPSSEHEKNKRDNSNKNENNYFISSNNTNSNNNSSINSTFKIDNKNNNKLKIISLKGTKLNNDANKMNRKILPSCEDYMINQVSKDYEINFGESSFNDKNKSSFIIESHESKLNEETQNHYEIVKEDNLKFNDFDCEINIEKEEIIDNFKDKETETIDKENVFHKNQKPKIEIDKYPNENKNEKLSLTPSVKYSKSHFNSFFINQLDESNLNLDNFNEKINQGAFNNSNKLYEQNQDPNLNGLIYNRHSLIIKKNSNNKNENDVEDFSPNIDLFNKVNVRRVKNRIYINPKELNKNVTFEEKSEKIEESLNVSNNLYIPGKQRMQLNKDPISCLNNLSNMNQEQNDTFEINSLEIMYRATEDKKDNIINSSVNSWSDRKNSKEKNKFNTNFSNKMKKFSSINSNNNLNDLSTSSISHNNKFVNCYISKKSSENEILNNINFNSNMINHYNNTSDKNYSEEINANLIKVSKRNVLKHQSMIFTKRPKFCSDKDSLNIASKAKFNLIQNLEEYFSHDNSVFNLEKILCRNPEEKKIIMNNSFRKTPNSVQNCVYRRDKSKSLKILNDKRTGETNTAKVQNSSNINFFDNINENVESEFSNSSDLVSSSQTLSNFNNNNTNKDSKNNLCGYAKKNSLNSNKSLNCSSNSVNFNNNLFNKEGNVINEIIDEDLLELEYSCSKSKLKYSLNFNTNSIQNSSLQRENLKDNHEFALNSPNNYEVAKEPKEFKKEDQIEIIYCQEENEPLQKKNENKIKFDEDFDLNEKLRKIKIENKDEDIKLECISNYIHEDMDFNNKMPNKRTNFKSSPQTNMEIMPSNCEVFDFSNFTHKKEKLKPIGSNSNNGDSEKRKSNKKVDFVESEIVFVQQTPNQLDLKYEIINYNSPLSIKKVDFNNNSVKNSIKSSSQISIVNVSQNNHYMVDENNINFLIQDFTFNLDDYIMEKSIGEGSYASVFTASSKINFKKYAIKKIIVDDISHVNTIVSEIRILSKFNHKNIIEIYGIYFKKLDVTTFALYILMELAVMDWESQIKNNQITKVLYTEMELLDMLKQITSCLSFLQQNSISHRDIKPNNILIFGDSRNCNSKSNFKNTSLIKVSDFGEARINQGNQTNDLYTIKGTELFMSPILTECYQNIEKLVDHNPYKSDCFSLGLCLLYAASLNLNSVYDIRNEIQEKRSISATINKYLKLQFTKKFIDLLMRMLDIDENKRFDFNELNEFLKKY